MIILPIGFCSFLFCEKKEVIPVVDAKIQAAIDTAIASLTPAEIESLTTHGVDSEVFARLARAGDPFWPEAMAAQLK